MFFLLCFFFTSFVIFQVVQPNYSTGTDTARKSFRFISTGFHMVFNLSIAGNALPIRMNLPNPSPWAGCDSRSIFMRSLIGLNSEFSFTLPGCHNKIEEPCLSYYFSLAGVKIVIHNFPKSISGIWNANNLVQNLNSVRRVHFLWRRPLHNIINLSIYLSIYLSMIVG